MNNTNELTCMQGQNTRRLGKTWLRSGFCVMVIGLASALTQAQTLAPASLSLADMKQKVAAAGMHGQPWDGPQSGPAGAQGK
ncbi:MAG: hypothetical protein PHH58_15505, partial [Rhodoferax sp.]|nr:hypothetical protein [Rhodoferax sp.]